MLKEIHLKDGNKYIISIETGYCTKTISFSKGYIENGTLTKSINFSIWDDMSFHGYLSTREYPDSIEFFFDLNDPIYFCLNRLLNGNDCFIIDDDDTYEYLKKYMKIQKEDKGIKIIFINLKNDNIHHNKYGAFIKNIGPDGRSKIEDIKVKYRIVDFFRECVNCLLEDYHQITFGEYLETLRLKENNNLTKARIK